MENSHGNNENFNSAEYWENRYRSGGTSGSGSFGRLATFKADFLNAFVQANSISKVIDFGTGNGVQTQLYDFPCYTGIDVSEAAIVASRRVFAGSGRHRFLLASEIAQATECDLSLSIDVIYHLIEDSVLDKYLRELFLFSERFVVIYSSDTDASPPARHVRHRQICKFVGERFPWWRHAATIKNPYPCDLNDTTNTTFSDFHIFVSLGRPCTIVVPPALGEY